ncbi:hypothetical protein HU200_023324 [Digitaria exilis]|uniref:Reverse transcriptase zinc-binding domain-containing protein n=1 Tax=Digitaria exilis TaxID=1010633 RepID=A0A835CCQ0_9POAL|nr:hypothetical protein HU200_023324 [Digitaria exilis]
MGADDRCPFCTEKEDCSHLFISCGRARSFWSSINLYLASVTDVENLWIVNPFSEPNQRVRTTLLICVCWNIWKCRNAKVFRSEDEINLHIASRCRDDLLLWSNRCSSPSDKAKIIAWSQFFFSG